MAYEIHTDVRYRPLERIDMGKLADDCTVPWWNQTLCQVNDCVARVGVFHDQPVPWPSSTTARTSCSS